MVDDTSPGEIGPDDRGDSQQVSFRFHARALQALGRDLVTDDVVAVMELVKNSYDAMATTVEVHIHQEQEAADGDEGEEPDGEEEQKEGEEEEWRERGYIEISDDGYGMDYPTIENVWCVIATPHRKGSPVSKFGRRSRSATGEKGLGRLSAARLGSGLEVTTKTPGGSALAFSVDWERLMAADDLGKAAFRVAEAPSGAIEGRYGTRLRITGLASRWSSDKIDELRENLSRLVSPFAKAEDFSLRLKASTEGTEPNLVTIESPAFLSEPKYSITGCVGEEGMIEYRYQYCPIGRPVDRECEDSEDWATVFGSLPAADKANLRESGPDCGPFEFELRAWDLTGDDTRDLAEHFKESRSYIRGAIRSHPGVLVYRDDVLVLPKSDSKRDWLGLDLRRVSRVGPRLSTSQIVGFVQISKADNPSVVDTSDREGLVSNPATISFRHLVTRVVGLLEGERHTDRMEGRDVGMARDLFADLTADPLVAKLEDLRDRGGGVGDAIEAAMTFGNELAQARAAIERRFGYYNRLAVIGTIAHLVIHEIRNRTTVIGRGLRKTSELAERFEDEVTARALELARSSVKTLEALADRFLPLASRSYRPTRRTTVVEESIERCLAMEDADIRSSGVAVEKPGQGRTSVLIDPGELDTIMLNLLTNSLYWMRTGPGERRLRLRLVPGPDGGRVTVSIDDTGPGIDPADRDRVFWPGVTRKPDGIGMGLTVAAELVDGRGGQMRTVVPGELGGVDVRV